MATKLKTKGTHFVLVGIIALIILLAALTAHAKDISPECASDAKCLWIAQCMNDPVQAMKEAGMPPADGGVKARAATQNQRAESCNTLWIVGPHANAIRAYTACLERNMNDIYAGTFCAEHSDYQHDKP
jgi:hypothetical protein